MLINVAKDAVTNPANCSLVHEPNVKSTWGAPAGALEAAQMDWKSTDGDLAWSGLVMFDDSSLATDSFAKVSEALKQCTSLYTAEDTQWQATDAQVSATAATWTIAQQDSKRRCQTTLRLQANLIAGGMVCSHNPSDYASEIADLVMSRAIELG